MKCGPVLAGLLPQMTISLLCLRSRGSIAQRAPIFLVTAFVALVLLARVHQIYLVAAALVSLGLAAALGVSRLRNPWSLPARLLSTLGVFLTINAAVLEGWWTFLRGRREVVWQHDRSRG